MAPRLLEPGSSAFSSCYAKESFRARRDPGLPAGLGEAILFADQLILPLPGFGRKLVHDVRVGVRARQAAPALVVVGKQPSSAADNFRSAKAAAPPARPPSWRRWRVYSPRGECVRIRSKRRLGRHSKSDCSTCSSKAAAARVRRPDPPSHPGPAAAPRLDKTWALDRRRGRGRADHTKGDQLVSESSVPPAQSVSSSG